LENNLNFDKGDQKPIFSLTFKNILIFRTCKKINEKIDEIKKKIRGEKVEKID
jgi:hypothetical protein